MDKTEYEMRIKKQKNMIIQEKTSRHKREEFIKEKAKYYHKIAKTLQKPDDIWNYDARNPKCPCCNNSLKIEYAYGAIFPWEHDRFAFAHCKHCGYEYGDTFKYIQSEF